MTGPVTASYAVDREPHPSPGRSIDRSPRGPRVDRRMVGVGDDDKWSKLPVLLVPGMIFDLILAMGLQLCLLGPGQGVNHGVLRNPWSIFDKALMEPTFCEMYADFCYHLSAELPDFSENNEKITFKRLLLNKCQEEFERGEREQAEADKADEEGEIQQTEGEREEKRIKARMSGCWEILG
ncbi:hypothetical protein J5N97_001821 [Dioscorea zingiberensis]|uniref:MIF4G domain-containing protein n=1 Tax=Dioscorea zingiberensis TaxID=325984 RepID=A0A9D5BTL0_9LILI|nr:hypothetical protein J5N97_001821 [Dioscorea zingiberensis]